MNKKIVYIDLDDTICNFSTHFLNKLRENPLIKYPQSQYGFFTDLLPLEGAIDGVNKLREKYDVYILSRPSFRNPLCYTEKRVWVEKYFGLDFSEKLILCGFKHLMIGDYLIDDFICKDFKGDQIIFGSDKFKNWESVLNYLI